MSLPFLKPEKMASVIVAKRKSDGSIEPSHEEGQHPPEHMAAAEDLIRNIHAKSAHGVASALKNLFSMLDSDSDIENPHEGPE